MTRHTIKAAFTRVVIIVSIAMSIGVGSVGIGGTADVAAMPINCYRVNLMANSFHNLSSTYARLGDASTANYFYGVALHWEGIASISGC